MLKFRTRHQPIIVFDGIINSVGDKNPKKNFSKNSPFEEREEEEEISKEQKFSIKVPRNKEIMKYHELNKSTRRWFTRGETRKTR